MSEPKKDQTKDTHTPVEREVVEVLAENETLKAENVELKENLDNLRKSLRSANDLIDSHTRSGLIARIKVKSDYGVEYLSKLTADQLRETLQHFDHVKTPKALMGADMPGEVKRELLGDVYGSWQASKVS